MPKRIQNKQKVFRDLADAYASGMSLREIAKKYGHAASTVKEACAKLGVKMRSRGASRRDEPERYAAIRAAIESGMPKRDVKKNFKCSHDIINRSLGLPETENAKCRRRYYERKRTASFDKALSDEVEEAIRRDREMLAKQDMFRRLRMAA